jgi:pimeloyl-ACP methyl ester carboxylesterase
MRRIILGVLVGLIVLALAPPLLARLFGWGRPDPHFLPAHGKTVDIGDGLELNVVEVGEGSPIVLVHGLPSCASDWATLPQKLAALGHRVIAYDRIGFGYSSRPPATPDRYTYASNARDLGKLLDALGIERAILVGWSYGGAVVQTFAEDAAQRVEGLVLVAAVGPAEPEAGDDALGMILNSGAGTAILDWVASVPPLGWRMTHDNLVQAFAREADIPPGWTEYTQTMLALPGTLQSFVLEEQRGHGASLHPEVLNIPAVVIQGTDDHLVPRFVGEDLQRRLPQSKLVLVPHGSHMLPVTHADLLAQEIDGLSHAALR